MDLQKLDKILTQTVNMTMLPVDKKIELRDGLLSAVSQACYQYENDPLFNKQMKLLLNGKLVGVEK